MTDLTQAIARELYRRLHPGMIYTHDSQRTPESDAAEMDRAYQEWDERRVGFAPGLRCNEIANDLAAVVEAHLRPVVTTVAELDSLPNGSVILSDNHFVFEATQDSLGDRAWAWGQKHRASKFIVLPATVLYTEVGPE